MTDLPPNQPTDVTTPSATLAPAPGMTPLSSRTYDELAQDVAGRSDALHNNVAPPPVRLQKEQPEHRLMVFLKAQGLSNKEIAAALGYTPVHVGTILRQPWAREQLLKLLDEKGTESVEAVIAAAAMDSVDTIVAIRDEEENGPQVRLAAARDLLDRYLGKATQRMEVKAENKITVEAVDQQLAELEAQEAVLLGRATERN